MNVSVSYGNGRLDYPHFAVESHQGSVQVADLANPSEDKHLRNFEHAYLLQLFNGTYRNERICNPLRKDIDPLQGD